MSDSRDTQLITIYRKAILVYNPLAGRLSRKRERLLHRAVEALVAGGHGVSVVPTAGPGTAGAIARQHIGGGADLILAAGGDGTINEILDGMAGSTVPLGILPAGTANVLARELRLDGDIGRAAARLGEFVPERIALGLLHPDGGAKSRYFLLMAGVGLDAHIVYHLHPGLKTRFGKLAYWLSGFLELGRQLEQFDVRIGDTSFRCSFALASRVRNYGGDIQIATTASLLDDSFEVVLFQGASAFRYLKYLAGVLTRRHSSMKGVSILRSGRIDFSAPPESRVYAQVDGEYAGRLPFSLEIVPGALILLMPPRYREQSWRHG